MYRKLIFASIFVAVLALASAPVQADTLTVNDVLFTATVTPGTVTLTVQCTDMSVCGGYFLGDVGLKGFTFTGLPSNITEPPNYAVQNGGTNNGTGGCNSTQLNMAVCWALTLPAPAGDQLSNGTLTFEAGIANGLVGTDGLHLQVTAWDDPHETPGTRVFAISNALNGGNITVPEPGTMALLGAGLLSLVGFGRRKITS